MVQHLIHLHMSIGSLFLDTKIIPNVGKLHALSVAVRSTESVDVNLKMFDLLGRLALTGHWLMWSTSGVGFRPNQDIVDVVRGLVTSGIQLIQNNQALLLPLMDEQAIEVALFLSLAAQTGNADFAQGWLAQMVRRYAFTVNGHGRYPCVFRDYRDLIGHPKQTTDEYRREATTGSVLIPLLAAWVAALGDRESLKILTRLKSGTLSHCTLQFWVPEAGSENHFYLNDAEHGEILSDLPLTEDGQDMLKILVKEFEMSKAFSGLSASASGYYPVLLTACRHYRLPIPPQFWIGLLVPDTQPATP